MKAIILARVSTKEQEAESSSLPAKTRRLTEYAEKEVFSTIKIPEDALKTMTEQLRASHHNEKAFYKKEVRHIQADLKKARQRMKVMYDDPLEGRITTAEYDKKLEQEKHKERDLILQLEEHSKADEEFCITSLYILELANRAVELFRSSKVEQKQQLINFVLSNLRLKGEKLLYDLKKPFDALVQMGKSQEWLPRVDNIRTFFRQQNGENL